MEKINKGLDANCFKSLKNKKVPHSVKSVDGRISNTLNKINSPSKYNEDENISFNVNCAKTTTGNIYINNPNNKKISNTRNTQSEDTTLKKFTSGLSMQSGEKSKTPRGVKESLSPKYQENKLVFTTNENENNMKTQTNLGDIEEITENQTNIHNKSDYWEFQISTRPSTVLKHMNDVYMKHNIMVKNLGLDNYELTKDRVKLKCYIKEEGLRFSNKICFKLIQGNSSKANEIMETINMEIETIDRGKKSLQDKIGNNFNSTLKMAVKI